MQFNDVNLLEAEGKIPDAIKTLKGILDATTKKTYSASEKSSRGFLLQTLAELDRTVEQYSAAVDVFHQLAELDPDAGARIEAEIIETYREAKEYPKAEAEAEAAAKKYPERPLLSHRPRFRSFRHRQNRSGLGGRPASCWAARTIAKCI